MAFRESPDVTVDAKMVTETKLTSHCFTLMLIVLEFQKLKLLDECVHLLSVKD